MSRFMDVHQLGSGTWLVRSSIWVNGSSDAMVRYIVVCEKYRRSLIHIHSHELMKYSYHNVSNNAEYSIQYIDFVY